MSDEEDVYEEDREQGRREGSPPGRGSNVLALLPPYGSRRMRALEGAARMALSVTLSVTRTLHSPVTTVFGDPLFLTRNTNLSRSESDMAAGAVVTMLRLATTLSHDIADVPTRSLVDAGKAYAALQALVIPGHVHQAMNSSRRSSLRGVLRRLSHPRSSLSGPQPPKELFNQAARYAFAAYGKYGSRFLDFIGRVRTDREALDELTGVDHTAEKQVLRSDWRGNLVGSLYRPGFYILLDHGAQELILAIRGSFRLQDVVTDLVAEDVDFDVADLEQFGPAEGDEEEEDDGGEVEEDDEDEDPKESNEDTSSDAALARAIAEAEADSDSDSFERPWAGFVPDDADEANELDAVFRRLSVALRGVRNNLDSQGDLVALQQSLQDWMTQVERSHDLADEEGDEACSLYRAKSEVEAETEGTNRQRTHLGFLRAANEVAREVEEDLVEAMLANAGYKLTIVGHSLGAAVATLLTIRWSSHPVLGSATCVGVASPCSTSRDFAESDVAKTKFNNIVLSDDVVPRLSLGSFMDLRDSLAYMARNGITERVMDIVGDGTGDPAELRSVLQPIYDEIVAVAHTNFKLYPPGNVWHIPRMAQSVDDARLVPVTDMGTIILSNEMFLSHLPNYYAHACIPESQESSTPAPEAT